MKIFISYPITNNPSGGGNQFLRNLSDELSTLQCLTNNPAEADVILYNGHHEVQKTSALKTNFPQKIFVHRMDGLQKLYNSPDDPRQDLAINYNKQLSQATIFQSYWAKEEFKKAGFNPTKSKVIYNFADSAIFNKNYKKTINKKTELLCTSWSPNPKKGFDFYKKLDSLLDFNKYNFTFVGNKPSNIIYENITCLPPERTTDIAQRMQNTDIFVSATESDCCSNSIIEALSSGVPTLALDSGSNKELIKDGGLLFKDVDSFFEKLLFLSINLGYFRNNIVVKNPKETTKQYLDFFYEIS
tara:strand:- start:1001 stop:1900 length:900 start_codon:yes stop_codon:yes gene_type:complete